mgnify:FL=1
MCPPDCRISQPWLADVEVSNMNKLGTVIFVLAIIGLVFVSGCTTGQATYTPASGPVGGGCGVGASVTTEDPCAETTDESVAL